MATQHEPNPSAAPVQKVRLRYAKRGRLRFTSHRDVARALERALRRAGVPMAYSQGFNPHPKVSWVGASPTGVASEAEYVELALVRVLDPLVLARELDRALPPGLDVLDAVTAGPGSLPDRIEASRWELRLDGVAEDVLAAAVETFRAAASVEVERMTKGGRRAVDVRAPVVSLVVTSEPGRGAASAAGPAAGCGILTAVVRQVSPAVRPDDVMSALRAVADLEPPSPVRATRVAQGPLDGDGQLGDPLAPDRVAAPAGSGAPGGHGGGVVDEHLTSP